MAWQLICSYTYERHFPKQIFTANPIFCYIMLYKYLLYLFKFYSEYIPWDSSWRLKKCIWGNKELRAKIYKADNGTCLIAIALLTMDSKVTKQEKLCVLCYPFIHLSYDCVCSYETKGSLFSLGLLRALLICESKWYL